MKKKSNWFWLAIIGVVLVVCIVAIGARMAGVGVPMPTLTPDPKESGELEVVGPIAVVYQYDMLVDAVDLGAITESYTKEYPSLEGGSNTVEYAPGDVRVIEATCPDHVCIGQSWLVETMGGILPIACLPNSLMIYMIPMEDLAAPEVDGATQ
ncbi:MAG: NusG domain II-containing protein [Oscillospiraceae bacterium]|nr:NusG domain II-containing protein [Oscillospiraceae bacterium]